MASGPQRAGFPVEQAWLVRDDGDSKVFEITRVGSGEETVSVGVDFEDGGFNERYFHLRTVLSDSGLEGIRLNYWSRPNVQPRLTACLKYTQLANCIGLSTIDGLNIRVMQPSTSVLRIDSSGAVHELSPGTATVIARVGRVQQSSLSRSVNCSPPRPAGILTRKAKYRRCHPQAEFLYCRQYGHFGLRQSLLLKTGYQKIQPNLPITRLFRAQRDHFRFAGDTGARHNCPKICQYRRPCRHHVQPTELQNLASE
jgi:hypothetical protein